MRASGIPAQYVSGTLSQGDARELILSMFPAQYQTVGYIPAGTQTSDPADDPQLLSETESHYWFQFETGSGMTDADPLIPGAMIGQSFATSTGTFTDVPQDLRETTEIQLQAETYSQAAAVFGFGDGISTTTVLDATFNDVDLVGRTLTVGNNVSSTSLGGLLFSSVTNTYTPYLEISDEGYPYPSEDTVITGTPYQEVLTNFSLGSQVLTGLFVNIKLSGPDGATETYTRTLADRIGYAARQGLTEPSVSVNPSQPPLISQTDLYTFSIQAGIQSPLVAAPISRVALQYDANLAALGSGASQQSTAIPMFARLLSALRRGATRQFPHSLERGSRTTRGGVIGRRLLRPPAHHHLLRAV